MSRITKWFLTVVVMAVVCGCTTTKYVPVIERHTDHHWHTDSVKERDSTHTERNTIIRELDSAAMARYGIQMESNQRAWLVLQREMENRLRELEHMTAQCDTVRDSIPVPYPVEVVKEVEKPLAWWQRAMIWIGIVAMMVVLVIVVWKLKRFLPTR